MTPIGKFSVLSETSWNPSIITMFMKFKGDPFSAQELENLWQTRSMPERHPRFHHVVTDQHQFQPEAPSTPHFCDTTSLSNKEVIRKYLQDLQLTRWNLAERLWQLRVAPHTLVFQGHHALGDGVSMGAAMFDFYDEADALRRVVREKIAAYRRRARSPWQRWVRFWQRLLYGLVQAFRALWHQGRLLVCSLVESNPWSRLRRVALLERRTSAPTARSLSWSPVASLEQIKWVCDELGAGVTVNDLFVSLVSAALARQLEFHRVVHEGLPKQRSVHIAVPVHLKGGVVLPGESVGNNIGAFVARLPGETYETDCVQRLRDVSRELHAVKRTPIAVIGYMMARTLSYASSVLPVSWASRLYAYSNAGSIAVVSNNRASPQPVHLAGREVEDVYGFVPLPPGIPVGVVVMSYAGKVNCSVAAEPWAVPDADQFVKWMLEEYLDLVQAVKNKKNS